MQQQQAQEAAAMQHQQQQQQQPEPEPEPEPAAQSEPQQQEYTGADPSNEMVPPAMRKALPARPTTARRAPPKLPTKEVKVTTRPKEGYNEPGSEPTSHVAVAGLITEDDNQDDDEFDAAAEAAAAGPTLEWDNEKAEDVAVDEDGMHGKLVGDILAEKQKLRSAQEQQGVSEPAPEEQPQGIVIRKKTRRGGNENRSSGPAAPMKKASENDVGQLREQVQALCQATNPLGKCIEYIQEDMENMEKEYRMWKGDSQAYSRKLDQQSNNTESSLVPLQQELGDHTEKVVNLTSQINRVKASILHNDMLIHNLLRGVVGNVQ
eukprot:TRINITY_DN4847_c0_g1_i3.p1 TRINITY_DN4847_c0_g1~~TRINITY_DN4847_c0_g1_i3.p1  ORF type:complete len:320 (+),score=119.47 TRINITY_DN4847_c0_g1_i3:747-1706(+)